MSLQHMKIVASFLIFFMLCHTYFWTLLQHVVKMLFVVWHAAQFWFLTKTSILTKVVVAVDGQTWAGIQHQNYSRRRISKILVVIGWQRRYSVRIGSWDMDSTCGIKGRNRYELVWLKLCWLNWTQFWMWCSSCTGIGCIEERLLVRSSWGS